MLCTTGYQFLLENLKIFPGNHLDIGVFDGDGMASLASAYPDKIIYGIDPFIEDGNTSQLTSVQRGESMATQEEKTVSRLTPYTNTFLNIMTSKEFLELLTPENITTMNINSIFIDGSHWYEDVLIDAELAIKLIGNNSGMITFDDLNNSEVKKAYDKVCVTYKELITDTFVIYQDGDTLYQAALRIN
jgi:hypothetical protein